MSLKYVYIQYIYTYILYTHVQCDFECMDVLIYQVCVCVWVGGWVWVGVQLVTSGSSHLDQVGISPRLPYGAPQFGVCRVLSHADPGHYILFVYSSSERQYPKLRIVPSNCHHLVSAILKHHTHAPKGKKRRPGGTSSAVTCKDWMTARTTRSGGS